MIIFRDYDKGKSLDKIWYKSSSIVYSECEDRENALKVLRVVFNNGSTYEYRDVDVNDYVMFVHGGIDGSNGKALNKYIKPNCPFTKLAAKNINELNSEMQKAINEQKKNQ